MSTLIFDLPFNMSYLIFKCQSLPLSIPSLYCSCFCNGQDLCMCWLWYLCTWPSCSSKVTQVSVVLTHLTVSTFCYSSGVPDSSHWNCVQCMQVGPGIELQPHVCRAAAFSWVPKTTLLINIDFPKCGMSREGGQIQISVMNFLYSIIKISITLRDVYDIK